MTEKVLKAESSKLDGIQVIRAIAALAVVFHHSVLESVHYFNLPQNNIFYDIAIGMSGGVDLFFVLSGFIIAYISQKEGIKPFDFIYKRILRVLPLYCFYTTLSLVIVLFFNNLKRESVVSVGYILGSYFMVPVKRPNDGVLQPLLGLGWTLNYEFFFYIIVFLFLFFKTAYRKALTIVTIILVVIIGYYLPSQPALFKFWTNPIILEFVFGILIAILFINKRTIAKPLNYILIVISVIFWIVSACYFKSLVDNYRFLFWGIPATLILAGTVLTTDSNNESKLKSLMIKIGDASFSLYLSHMFVIRIVTLLMIKTHIMAAISLPIFILFVLITSVLVSFLSFNYIEKPIMAFAKRLNINK